jgi:hypothetical protein
MASNEHKLNLWDAKKVLFFAFSSSFHPPIKKKKTGDMRGEE